MWYYLIISASLLYITKNYIWSGVSVVYNLHKYKNDKKFEAVKITKRILTVPYRYQHHEYYALLPVKSHNPITVLNVYTLKNDLDNDLIMKKMDIDITEDIHKYLGHNGDFSGCSITPHTFGFTNLKFKVMSGDGEVKTLNFKENDIISFDKDG